MEVPEERIAQNPSKKRDNCKLMVLDPKNQTFEHKKFYDIADYMRKGDVLVMNNTHGLSSKNICMERKNLNLKLKCFY